MYKTFVGRNGNQLYHEVLRSVQDNGIKVAPRGKPTLEIQGITTILKPQERVLTVPGRGNNPFFNVAENLAILHGLENQRDFLVQFNKNWASFFDNDTDKSQWGFYGVRLRKWDDMEDTIDQLKKITKKLEEDKISRQAVASLWHPALDNEPGHKDYPCNWGIMFKIRDRVDITKTHLQGTFSGGNRRVVDETKVVPQLNMTVVNRSNDIHWGLFGVNLSQFSFLQEVLAHILGVELGDQTHISDSLHLYTAEATHKEITDRIKQYAPFDIYELTPHRPLFEPTGRVNGWTDIDVALETFFNSWQRDSIGRGEEVSMYPFQFLFDARLVLQAYLSRKDDTRALEILDGVQDNALWVACVEYLTRLKKYEPVKDDQRFGILKKACEDRFGMERGSKGMDAAMNYIYHYFWAKSPTDIPLPVA